jgi:LuxR family maltose regulon positive regulatory protein
MDGYMYGLDDLCRGELLFYQNELRKADAVFKVCANKSLEYKQYDIYCHAKFYEMRIALVQGDIRNADTVLKGIETLSEMKDYPQGKSVYDIAAGWYYLALRKSDSVPEWLKGNFSFYAHSGFLENFGNYIRFRYHYALGEYSMLYEFAEEQLKRGLPLYGRIEIKVMQSMCQYRLRHNEAACQKYTEAYELACPNGIIMPFIEHGKSYRSLALAMAKVKGNKIPADWMEQVNRKASSCAKRQDRLIKEYGLTHKSNSAAQLTTAEHEILMDLSTGLSISDISVGKEISMSRVKQVMESIYAKLGTDNITAAVYIATKQNLL